MPPRRNLHAYLLPLSIVGFIAITFGADVFARVYVQGASLPAGLGAAANEPATNFMGFVLLALPVVAAHFLAVEFAHVVSIRSGYLFLALILAALALLYGSGYVGFQEAMGSDKWTAASLSLGLLPVKGALLLLIPAVVTLMAQKSKRK